MIRISKKNRQYNGQKRKYKEQTTQCLNQDNVTEWSDISNRRLVVVSKRYINLIKCVGLGKNQHHHYVIAMLLVLAMV